MHAERIRCGAAGWPRPSRCAALHIARAAHAHPHVYRLALHEVHSSVSTYALGRDFFSHTYWELALKSNTGPRRGGKTKRHGS